MTNKELRRLRRKDLMEMLLELTEENERLREELDHTKEELENKFISIQEVGSLAEASLKLNQVFEAAQAACDQYTKNIQLRYLRQKKLCEKMEQETREKCAELLKKAQTAAGAPDNMER